MSADSTSPMKLTLFWLLFFWLDGMSSRVRVSITPTRRMTINIVMVKAMRLMRSSSGASSSPIHLLSCAFMALACIAALSMPVGVYRNQSVICSIAGKEYVLGGKCIVPFRGEGLFIAPHQSLVRAQPFQRIADLAAVGAARLVDGTGQQVSEVIGMRDASRALDLLCRGYAV